MSQTHLKATKFSHNSKYIFLPLSHAFQRKFLHFISTSLQMNKRRLTIAQHSSWELEWCNKQERVASFFNY